MEEQDPHVVGMQIRPAAGGIRGGEAAVEMGRRRRSWASREKASGAGVDELLGQKQSTPRPRLKAPSSLTPEVPVKVSAQVPDENITVFAGGLSRIFD